MKTPIGIKFILDVLYVPQIDQNLLSVAQMVERNYVVLFKDKTCIIIDPIGHELMIIQMKDKTFL